MSTITYQNEFGNEISQSQTSQLETYIEVIIDGNNTKLTNFYTNGVLTGTMFTISSYNDVVQILQSNSNASFEINSKQGNYSITDQISYNNSVLNFKMTFVSNELQNTICVQKYDITTGLPQYLATNKYYYDENGLLIYQFIYNADGSCFSIEMVQVISTDSEFLASKIGVDPEIQFSWQGFDYYQNAEPLVPQVKL